MKQNTQEQELSKNVISITVSAPQMAPVGVDGIKLVFSQFDNRKSNHPIRRELTWGTLKAKLSKHSIRQDKDGVAYSPVSYFVDASRGNDGVEYVSCLVADIDNGTPIEKIKQFLKGHAYLIYTSFSHSPEHPKYRAVVPFAKPVPASMWGKVWHQGNELLGGNIDPATKDIARIYYMPAHPPGAEGHVAFHVDGRLLDPETLPQPAYPTEGALQVATSLSARNNGHIVIEGLEEVLPELNPKVGLDVMIERCAFMREASKPENQNNVSEALWRALITNAMNFDGGKDWIHESSCDHDEYSQEHTDAKIQYALEKGYSPDSCQRICEQGFNGCPSGGCTLPSGKVTKAPAGLMAWIYSAKKTGLNDSSKVGEFTINDHGVFAEKAGKEDEVQLIRIASRIDVVAMTRSANSDKWGLLMAFKDPDGNLKKWALSTSMLSGSGEDVRKVLLDMGATVEPGRFERDKFNSYLMSCKPVERVVSVTQPGWHQIQNRLVYVLNDRAIGQANEQVVLQTSDPKAFNIFDSVGSADDWQNQVASLCVGNSRLQLAICAALTAPVLNLLGQENIGFHFVGSSSIGKTIALKVAASVWGGGKTIQTWRATSNALEAIASRHNDSILCLDEMGQVDGKEIGEATYMLGNGLGKARATINAEAKEVRRFRLVYFSNGEVALSDHMQTAGKRVMAGQEVRLINIPADAGAGYGIFDSIHDAENSADFAARISSSAMQYYGHAGLAFVEALVDLETQQALLKRIREKQTQFMSECVPEAADGQVIRVGQRFALIAAVGEVCAELNILPWQVAGVSDGVHRCYMDWIKHRGGVGNLEAVQVVAQVRRFFEQHGESRFSQIEIEGIATDRTVRTVNRAGFRKATTDGRTEYFVLPEMFKGEVCCGLNPQYVIQVLVEKGLLKVGADSKPQVAKRLPGMGTKRVYHVLPSIHGEAVAENEDDIIIEPQVSEFAKRYNV